MESTSGPMTEKALRKKKPIIPNWPLRCEEQIRESTFYNHHFRIPFLWKGAVGAPTSRLTRKKRERETPIISRLAHWTSHPGGDERRKQEGKTGEENDRTASQLINPVNWVKAKVIRKRDKKGKERGEKRKQDCRMAFNPWFAGQRGSDKWTGAWVANDKEA